MVMPERKFQGPDYRFGFQGMEKSDELKGNGNSYTAEFWEFDPRVARRFNADPLNKTWESPYVTLSNNPLNLTDITGLSSEPPSGTGKEGQAKETTKRIYGARGSYDQTTVWYWHSGGLTTGKQKWSKEKNTLEPVLSIAGWYTEEQYTEILSKSNA